jgi:hypothetical protein
VRVERLADGLWWWTSIVEGRELGSLYVESEAAISLLDPVLPLEDGERFLRALDRDVERHGGPVHVFFSASGEAPLARGLFERYGAVVQSSSTADVEIQADGFHIPAHGVRFLDRAVVGLAERSAASSATRRSVRGRRPARTRDA